MFTMIRSIVTFILIIICISIAAPKNRDIEGMLDRIGRQPQMLDARYNLMLALEQKNIQAVDSLIEVLSKEALEFYALDRYELLQINLLLERYDKALDIWFDEYANAGNTERFSFARVDTLQKYLDSLMDLTDNNTIKIESEKIRTRTESQEKKDLISLLEVLSGALRFYKKKHIDEQICDDSLFYLRVSAKFYVDVGEYNHKINWDWEAAMANAQKALSDYSTKYPSPRIVQFSDYLIKYFKESAVTFQVVKDPVLSRRYTGCFGIEAFINLTYRPGLSLGVPIQIWRIILIPAFQFFGKLSGPSGTAGFVVFDSRHVKVFPLVNMSTGLGFGGEIDYRFYISEGSYGLFGVWSLNFRYVGGRYETETQNSIESRFQNRFMLGVSGYLW